MGYPKKGAKLGIRRIIKRLVWAAVIIYAVVGILCTTFQRQLMYFPPHRTPEQLDQAAKTAGFERWRNAAGEAIGVKRLSPSQPASGALLIVYGNASWSLGCAHYADDIQGQAPVDVYILDYPGYADRPGKPTQETLFRAADEALQLLGTNLPVRVLGESLGSGVASYLAGTHPGQIAGLVLLSPFERITSVAQSRFPFMPASLVLIDQYPSEDYLRNYHGPVAITLDGRDKVVPERFGQRLYDGYAGPKKLWRFPERGHIGIDDPAQFWAEVLEFWRTNQVSPP